jgi:hypothetical protein
MNRLVIFVVVGSWLVLSANERAAAEPTRIVPVAMVTWPTQNYDADRLILNSLVAGVVIKAAPSGPIIVNVSGSAEHLANLTVRKVGTALVIADIGQSHTDHATIDITLPHQTPIETHGLVGSLSIDSSDGSLTLDVTSAELFLGRVATAVVSTKGTSRLRVDQAANLKLSMSGSSMVEAGQVGTLQAQCTGSVKIELQKLTGAADVDITGSGTAYIHEGTANPLHVKIIGAGQFEMDGTAIDPFIEGVGAGLVRLKAYSGRLNTQGTIQVRIGS